LFWSELIPAGISWRQRHSIYYSPSRVYLVK
jgi:hypothetical protein